MPLIPQGANVEWISSLALALVVVVVVLSVLVIVAAVIVTTVVIVVIVVPSIIVIRVRISGVGAGMLESAVLCTRG